MHPILWQEDDTSICSLSDRAVLVSFGHAIDEVLNQRVLALHQTLQVSAFAGFIESVPAYGSLAVFYDSIKIAAITKKLPGAFVADQLRPLLDRPLPVKATSPAVIKIPVCYHPACGPDLEALAISQQLSVPEIIQLHCAVSYRVYMIGFLPGFAYMGSVHPQLAKPRKSAPVSLVPAGSVGIAGSQTGIYPVDSPGGWQIIGRTPMRIFDLQKDPPALFSPGDEVQFYPIDQYEFDTYVH